MQYAIVESQKCEAAPGLVGKCPGCNNKVIAKCGEQRIWHWAHLGQVTCTFEWERETIWHRIWKSAFPEHCREIIGVDLSGEKHIADVKTELGLVVELQHSHLTPQERRARESFHQDMIWVVDGSRLKRDLPRFLEGQKSWRTARVQGFWLVTFPEESFPRDWLDSHVTVYFDFEGTSTHENTLALGNTAIWALLPGRADGQALVAAILRKDFVIAANLHPENLPGQKLTHMFDTVLREKRKEDERQASTQALAMMVRRKQFARRRYPRL